VGGLNGFGKIRCLPDHFGVVGPVGNQIQIKTAVDYTIEVKSIQDSIKKETAKIAFMALSEDGEDDDDDEVKEDLTTLQSGMIQAESQAP